MDTSQEGRLASGELLTATWNGLGHGETAIFPISIFQIKEGVNYNIGDPNYDLFELAMKVSAKRLFPNFLSLDATFNKPYYKVGDYNSYVTAMGYAAGEELIIYTYRGKTYVEGLESLWNRLKEKIQTFGISKYKETHHLSVWDANEGRFVNVYRVIKNPDQCNWTKVIIDNGRSLLLTEDHPLYTYNRGRRLVKDLRPGDKIETYFNMPTPSYEQGSQYGLPEHYYLRGINLVNPSNMITMDFETISSKMAEKIKNCLEKIYTPNTFSDSFDKNAEIDSCSFFSNISEKQFIPAEIFNAPRYARLAYLAGIIDGGGGFTQDEQLILKATEDKEFALQELALIQSLGYPAYLKEDESEKYFIESNFVNFEIAKYRCESEEKYWLFENIDKREEYLENTKPTQISEIKSVISLGYLDKDSYDLETSTDKFTLSFVNSGNCRTRVMSNVNGPEESGSRGNFAFVTLNLPQIALESKQHSKTYDEMMTNFWNLYDKYINLSKEYLEYRFEIIAKKKVKNFPFLMKQKIYMESENLDDEDEIRPALKHASLSIGYCGLAECLVALTGKHHGESEESQELGLKIVKYLRKMTDKFTKETHMNWTAFSSPAESVAGEFLRATRKKYGIIKGVTDREYFTNSNHVPVYYPISAIDKIKTEAPYHSYTNAGNISYIEMNGDPLKNFEAFKSVVRAMHDANMGYFSINHPVDRDPVCGYTGIIENECPHCHRKEQEKHHLKMKF